MRADTMVVMHSAEMTVETENPVSLRVFGSYGFLPRGELISTFFIVLSAVDMMNRKEIPRFRPATGARIAVDSGYFIPKCFRSRSLPFLTFFSMSPVVSPLPCLHALLMSKVILSVPGFLFLSMASTILLLIGF